jgi:short-subunit dehydrogenase
MESRTRDHSKGFLMHYGPWAVVAGASEGLGAAYAEALAERKLNLILIARRKELVEELASTLKEKYNIEICVLPLDLASPDAAERICQETEALDVGLFIYNAAFSAVGTFLNQPQEDHLNEVDTNIRTPLRLVYHFGTRMLAAGHGGIVLMTSLSAFQGSAYISNYSATKAFNLILAEGLWEEWRHDGVDVLACIAGAIRTPNYLASRPRRTGRFSDTTLQPNEVVTETFAALGHQSTVIPGKMNRLSSFVMRRLLSRQASIRFMGSVLRSMYVRDPDL